MERSGQDGGETVELVFYGSKDAGTVILRKERRRLVAAGDFEDESETAVGFLGEPAGLGSALRDAIRSLDLELEEGAF